MLVIFSLLGALSVVMGLVYWRAGLAGAAEKARLRSQIEERVAAAGLRVDGDATQAFGARGSVQGVDLDIHVGSSRKLPGASEVDRDVTVVELAMTVPNQIVCRTEDVDLVMGALPAVPRETSGDPAFDRAYSMFASGRADGAYRDGAAPFAWCTPELLSTLASLKLVYMRILDGRCEVAFAPREEGDIAAVAVAAANISRRTRGIGLAPRPTFIPEVTSALDYGRVRSTIGGSLAVILGSPVGAVLGFLPQLRAMNAETCCGKGGEILVSSSSDDEGTSYGLYCSNDRDASLFVHYLSAIAIVFIAVFGFALIRALLVWPKRIGG